MEHVYAALTLLAAGRAVSRENLAAVVAAAGVEPSAPMVEALVHLCGVLAGAARPSPGAAVPPRGAPGGGVPAPGHPPEGRGAAPAAGAPGGEGLPPEGRGAATAGAPAPGSPSACYLYGVVPCDEEVRLGVRGVGGSEVYTVARAGLAALVHDWPPGSAVPEREEELRAWAEAHLAVLDAAGRRFGTVLPVAVGRLVGREGQDAREVVRGWLQENADSLRERCRRLAGQQEYGLQVLWDPEAWAAQVAGRSRELRGLEEALRSATPGQAYLLQQRFEEALRGELEARAATTRDAVLGVVRGIASDFRVEPNREVEGRRLLLNLTCLVPADRIARLGEELEALQGTEAGLEVRWTGPWPPYTFAA